MERILSIEEKTFKTDSKWSSNYDGYVITTDKQVIKVGISNGQSCCESWGELMSEDDLSDYVGANLIKAYITDTALKNYDLGSMDCGDVMFVTFETDKGVFQFVAYNSHNGYYGHDAVFVYQGKINTEVL